MGMETQLDNSTSTISLLSPLPPKSLRPILVSKVKLLMIILTNISIRLGSTSIPPVTVRLRPLEWVDSSDSSAPTCKSTSTDQACLTVAQNVYKVYQEIN